MNKQFFIFTDGSAIGNPGPAGWAAIVIHGTRRQEIAGSVPRSTVSEMELRAAVEALRLTPSGAGIARSDPPSHRTPSKIPGSGRRVPLRVRRPVQFAPRSHQEGYPIPRRSQKANLLLQSLTWFFSSLELWSASSIRRQFVPERQLLWRLGRQSHRHGIGLDGRCAL